jgi:hypothetical protein
MSAEVSSPPRRTHTEADLLRYDPEGDITELLIGWESSYRYDNPEKRKFIGGREITVAELIKEERADYEHRLREKIRQVHTQQAQALESQRKAEQAAQDAWAGKPRAELGQALVAYDVWVLKNQEAERILSEAHTKKSDLTASQAPLGQLKKALADANAEIEAAEIRLGQIRTEGQPVKARLETALGPAGAELLLRRNKEQEKRTDAALNILQTVRFDSDALDRQLRIYDLRRLAACAASVTRLEGIRFDGYRSDIRTQARDLLSLFEKLDTELSSQQEPL